MAVNFRHLGILKELGVVTFVTYEIHDLVYTGASDHTFLRKNVLNFCVQRQVDAHLGASPGCLLAASRSSKNFVPQ